MLTRSRRICVQASFGVLPPVRGHTQHPCLPAGEIWTLVWCFCPEPLKVFTGDWSCRPSCQSGTRREGHVVCTDNPCTVNYPYHLWSHGKPLQTQPPRCHLGRQAFLRMVVLGMPPQDLNASPPFFCTEMKLNCVSVSACFCL